MLNAQTRSVSKVSTIILPRLQEKVKKVGDCKECGDDSIDWARIYLHNLNDIEYTFNSLKRNYYVMFVG